jgi:hypothetical protein
MLKLAGISFGMPMVVLGLGGMIVTIHGLLDPSGAQLSDDSNPFGTPPSLSHSLLILAMYVALCAAGAVILWGCFRKRRASV